MKGDRERREETTKITPFSSIGLLSIHLQEYATKPESYDVTHDKMLWMSWKLGNRDWKLNFGEKEKRRENFVTVISFSPSFCR